MSREIKHKVIFELMLSLMDGGENIHKVEAHFVVYTSHKIWGYESIQRQAIEKLKDEDIFLWTDSYKIKSVEMV